LLQVTVVIQAEDDPPVAEDMDLILYSGRNTTFPLAAYDPDGSPIEIFILKEPQGGTSTLKLTDEAPVSANGLRRKVSERNTTVVYQVNNFKDCLCLSLSPPALSSCLLDILIIVLMPCLSSRSNCVVTCIYDLLCGAFFLLLMSWDFNATLRCFCVFFISFLTSSSSTQSEHIDSHFRTNSFYKLSPPSLMI
jgi:hypothetical protein